MLDFEKDKEKLAEIILKELTNFTQINLHKPKTNQNSYELMLQSTEDMLLEICEKKDITFCMPTKENDEMTVHHFVKNLGEVILCEDFGEEKNINTETTIISYMRRSYKLDNIFSKLTKKFCAESCPCPPIGCCGYHFNELQVPNQFLFLQKKEAKRNGLKKQDSEDKCDYHDNGCYLRLFKSPICLGFICPDLRTELSYKHEKSLLSDLFESLSKIKYFKQEENFDNFLKNMDKTIETGYKLIKKQAKIYKAEEPV